jgi:hypothetical protein
MMFSARIRPGQEVLLFSASKIVVGLLIVVGFLYPLGKCWYISVILGALIVGWGWKESKGLTQKRLPVPSHKIAGPILLAAIIANIVRLLCF